MNKQLSMDDTLLSGTNAPFIEGLYEAYRQNPDSVPPEWHGYFDRAATCRGNRLGLLARYHQLCHSENLRFVCQRRMSWRWSWSASR